MYFYLSKSIGNLGAPSNFILLVISFGLLLWMSRFARVGERLTGIATVMLLVGAISPLGTVLALLLENRFSRWDEGRVPPVGVIVLGGVVDTYVSLQRHEVTLDRAANRLVAAVELYRRYPDMRIVFSGGNSDLILGATAESRFAVRFLEDLGVPEAHISTDDLAHNTLENAVNAKEIAAPKPGERWLLITSAMHMPRAISAFRSVDFQVEAYPVDYQTGSRADFWAPPFPSLKRLALLDEAAHEWEGLFIDRIIGRSTQLFPGPINGSAGPR